MTRTSAGIILITDSANFNFFFQYMLFGMLSKLLANLMRNVFRNDRRVYRFIQCQFT